MDFDPDAFLAQPQPTAQPASQSGFDPDAFLSETSEREPASAEAPSSPGETIQAGLEAAGRGILGPLAPIAEREILGIPKSEQLAREKAHPIASGVGEAAGLVGSTLTGVGEGAIMGKAGELAAHVAGLAKPATQVAKIGSSAVKAAIEGAVLQSGDEITKTVLGDPDTASQSAIGNIGMAAALGAGVGAFVTGAVSPLWKATVGSKLEGALTDIQAKLGGVENPGNKQSVEDIEKAIGREFNPTVRGAIDGNPVAQHNLSILNQTDHAVAGRKVQDVIRETTDMLGDEAAASLGRAPEALDSIKVPDKYSTGRTLADNIASDLEPEVKRVGERYDRLNKPFQEAAITDAEKQDIKDQIAANALREGWSKSANSANNDLTEKISEMVSKQSTVKDLGQFVTNLRQDNPWGSEGYQAAKAAANIIRGVQESAIVARMEPGTLAEYNATRSAYKSLMDKIESIDQHLKVGRWEGPQTFLNALKEKGEASGEAVLRNLSGENKANVLEVLNKFPTAAGTLRNYHVDDLLSDAAKDAQNKNLESKINTTRLMKNFREMSPQMQSFLATPEQQAKLNAVDTAMNRLKDPHYNWSNTARTMNKIMPHAETPLSLALGLLSGHAVAVPVLAYLGKMGLSEGIPAVRLALLKHLGTNAAADAVGFKSAVQLVANSQKFLKSMTRSAQAVFKPGAQVLGANLAPSLAANDKLDKIVANFQENPESAYNLADSKVGHYMPEHQVSLTSAMSNNLRYLSSLKPKPQFISPLDKEIPPSPSDEARYNRALSIANAPLSVLQHVKNGSLQVSDLQDLKAMYPAVYSAMAQKLSAEMISNKDSVIPYRTRMSLSLFLGHPVDATMQPQSILSAQPQPVSPAPPPGPKTKKGTSTLGKSNNQYLTPGQASEKRRSKED